MTKNFRFAFIGVAFVIVFAAIYMVTNSTKAPDFSFDNVELIQLEAPKDGQDIAIFDTNLGEFRVMLFTEECPNTVSNFKELINSGYYSDTHVFAVETGVYFMGGSKTDDGNYSDLKNHKKVEFEGNVNLLPLKGALISYGFDTTDYSFFKKISNSIKGAFSSKKGSNIGGTYFMGINSVEFTDDLINEMRAIEGANSDVIEAFINNGGVPNFTQQYTVFAQTYKGLDVFEQISQAITDEKTKIPIEKIVINSVTLSKYSSVDEESSVEN